MRNSRTGNPFVDVVVASTIADPVRFMPLVILTAPSRPDLKLATGSELSKP